MSRWGEDAGSRPGLEHRSRFVNGPDYDGMADNDLRGFPDGGFQYGWNQSTQAHVRVGRRDNRNPAYGEHELFRMLHRWDAIPLPGTAEVVSCRLEISVEDGPEIPLRLFLYEVRRDWNPGAGGVERNNVSVPEKGEVWWGDAKFGEEGWGLPGAGFSSDADPEADVAAMPLADASWEPGQDTVAFASERLTAYLASRLAKGEPLLWMIKVSDDLESTPGSFLGVYSAEYGDSRHPVRRPSLEIHWRWPSESLSTEIDVHLERGRVHELPRYPVAPGSWMASFWPEEGGPVPVIETREGTGDRSGPWRRLVGPHRTASDCEWVQLRLLAMRWPLRLGEDFEADLANTWVLTGPPERQRVAWTFESPAGVVHEVEARHEGSFRWSVRFRPDEPGRWSFRWTESFLPSPHGAPPDEFDVWADDLDRVVEQLEALRSDLDAGTVGGEVARRRMYALEAAGMRLLDPPAHRGEPGETLRRHLRPLRQRLAPGPLPDTFPMESHELLEESGGHRFSSPIPRVGKLGHGPGAGASPGGSRLKPRLLEWLRRLLGRARRRLPR